MLGGFEQAVASNDHFAGLIHLALPDTKIIHSMRDPVGTAFRLSRNVFGETNRTCELAEPRRYYGRDDRPTTHWRRVLPEGRVLDVRHEDVIADLKAGRGGSLLIVVCPGASAVRRSHDAAAGQNRKRDGGSRPIYKNAAGRWRVYLADLRRTAWPLLNALNEHTVSGVSLEGPDLLDY
jgi:hypothetical protein